MKKSDEVLLEDVVEAIGNIQRFCRRVTSQKFYRNVFVQSAVIRQFEIIGEAINHLSGNIKELNPEIDWAKAVSFRNILIHGYREVDYHIVWDTINNDLPTLKKQIEKILKK